MEPTVTLEQAIREFRRMLPGSTNTARTVDHGALWEQTAINAVNDGYIHDARPILPLAPAEHSSRLACYRLMRHSLFITASRS
jgi:hypothetical protein